MSSPDVDGDREEAIDQAEVCDKAYETFKKMISLLQLNRDSPSLVMKHLADLRTHTSCVKARQLVGFKWGTLFSVTSLESILSLLVSHRDALIAGKAKDLLTSVSDCVRLLFFIAIIVNTSAVDKIEIHHSHTKLKKLALNLR